MDTLLNIRAFLASAKYRSFSRAAQEIGVAPSVVTKRISQLEEQLGVSLFLRSTRGLGLTDAAQRLLPRYQTLVTELDEISAGAADSGTVVKGSLRIKAPTTVTSMHLGRLITEFHVRHPSVNVELVLLDRSTNPMEENYDMVIGALPDSYPNVEDVRLAPYPLVLCAAPDYLARRGLPREPAELVAHDCLTSLLLGRTWRFESACGPVSVEVRSKFRVNDGQVLLDATRRGLGLAPLPQFLAREDLCGGRLVAVLPEFPLVLFWLKALVPRVKMSRPAVRELVNFLQAAMQPVPPWDRAPAPEAANAGAATDFALSH